MEASADSVDAEPVFGRPTALSVSVDNGIGGEPTLASSSAAADAAKRSRAWYIPTEELTDGVIAWRLSVCTFVHVAAAALTGIGLAKEWRRMSMNRCRFEFAHVMPWLLTAMHLHGFYNFGALLYHCPMRRFC